MLIELPYLCVSPGSTLLISKKNFLYNFPSNRYKKDVSTVNVFNYRVGNFEYVKYKFRENYSYYLQDKKQHKQKLVNVSLVNTFKRQFKHF